MSLSTLPRAPVTLKWAMLLSVALLLILTALNEPLITASAPQGLISFQLAATAGHSLSILASWGEAGKAWAVGALWIDFLFIPVYLVTLLLLTGYLLSDRPGIRERKVGNAVRALFLAAGISNMGENVLLLNNLSAPTDNISLAATVFALLKFTGLVIGAAGLVIIRAARRHPLQH